MDSTNTKVKLQVEESLNDMMIRLCNSMLKSDDKDVREMGKSLLEELRQGEILNGKTVEIKSEMDVTARAA